MTVLDSPITSYSDTTPQKRIITDVISLIDPADAPAIEVLGGLDGAASKFRFVPGLSTTVEWLEDTLADLTDASNGSIASNTTAVTVDDASIFQEGHIILIDSEQMWVSAVNTSSEVLTVTRGYSGTQASHADNAAVEIVGMARLEGDESDDIAFTDRTVGSNYTQILHKEIKVSRTHEQLSQYGIADEFDYQAAKAVPELVRLLEKQLYRGARKAGSATTPRAMGGFGTFITDNTINAGGAVTQADFEDALEAAFNDGGYGPWAAFCSPSNMQVIKNFYDSSNFLQVSREETTAGMVIQDIVTPFGNVSLVMDRWAPSGTIYIVDPEHAGMLTYYPFTQEPLSKGGDYEKGEVVGEFTLCVRQDKAHAVITGIS
jgi:hypothetical protein